MVEPTLGSNDEAGQLAASNHFISLGPGIEDGLGRWMIWEWITNWVLIAMSISGKGSGNSDFDSTTPITKPPSPASPIDLHPTELMSYVRTEIDSRVV